jgi:hypothetical protein
VRVALVYVHVVHVLVAVSVTYEISHPDGTFLMSS